MADSKPRRTYSQEEVNAILARAIERQSTSDLSHEELTAAAAEVGVSAEALDEAAREVTAQRTRALEEQELRVEKWAKFWRHLRSFVLVNAMGALIFFLTGIGVKMVMPMFTGWGIGLAIHFLVTALSDPARERVRRERRRALRAEREAIKEERRRAKERRRDIGRHLEQRADEFGHAVSRGVATILEVAADKINETVDAASKSPRRASRPDLGAPPVVTPPPRPQVRVEREARPGVRVGETTPPIVDAEFEDDPASARARRR
jgi:gas vesicle protein